MSIVYLNNVNERQSRSGGGFRRSATCVIATPEWTQRYTRHEEEIHLPELGIVLTAYGKVPKPGEETYLHSYNVPNPPLTEYFRILGLHPPHDLSYVDHLFLFYGFKLKMQFTKTFIPDVAFYRERIIFIF